MEHFEPTVTDSDSAEALHLILSAREEGADAGIAPELIAYAALYTALIDLVSVFGEESAAAMTDGLSKRVREGEFTHYGTLQ